MTSTPAATVKTHAADDRDQRAAPWRPALAAVVAVALLTFVVPTAGIALGGPDWERATGNVMSALHSAIALLAAMSMLRGSRHVTGRSRRAWVALGVGMLLYALAQIAWSTDVFLGRNSGGGPAWLPAFTVANLVLLVGALMLPPSRRKSTKTRRLDVAIMMAAATCLLWVLPLNNLVQHSAANGGHVVELATLGAVKVVTVLVAMAVLVRCRPDARNEIRPLAFGLILLGVADLVFASVDNSTYPMMSRFADALYNASAVMLTVSGRRLAGAPADPPPVVAGTRRHRLAPPETVTVIALVALAINAQFDPSFPVASLVLGSVLVLLAIARLGQLEHEQRQLVESLRSSARRLHDQARIDTLTGLGNRLALDERLKAVVTRPPDDRGLAVFFVDVDHFKRFNDGLGHHVGDQLLTEISGRLRDVLGDGVHRVGGDEFVAVRDQIDSAEAELLAQDVVTIARSPVSIGGPELSCTVSVGLAHLSAPEMAAADPRDGRGVSITSDPDGTNFADALLRRADLALYGAKELGRNQWSIYDPLLQQRADARLRLQQGLHRALEKDEIEVHYRPVVDLVTREVVGAAATPRWRSPEHGLLLPDAFMPAVIEGGLIPQIGSVVLGDIAASLRRLGAAGHPLRWISVSLFREAIVHPRLVDLVADALQAAGTGPERLRIAVTEDTVVDEAALKVLHELRDLGVHLVVHQFGTGPSSMLNLGSYVASTITVDQSFVEGLGRRHDDTVIVKVVAGLTADLGMELAADGISEEFQARMLAEMGCSLGQGRLFGEAAPLEPRLAHSGGLR